MQKHMHGYSNTRLYHVWAQMIQRCSNPNTKNWKYYGGRGISVCPEWREFTAFREWALKSGYDENAKRGDCTIDRIDCNGNYEPSNCRWVSLIEQLKNRRPFEWPHKEKILTGRQKEDLEIEGFLDEWFGGTEWR